MIENFEPQPFPLECSTDGQTWALVIGWKKDQLHRVMPVVSPGLTVAGEMTADLQFRQAMPPTSTLRVSAAASSAPAPVAPGARVRPARRPQAT